MFQKWYNLESEIVLLLLKGENHLRGLATSLKESPSTTMRTLNKLVEENVLDYSTRGKNKTFSIKKNIQAKNYIFNAERYKLMKLISTQPKIGVIAEDILKNCDSRLVVIFGSYAKFIPKEDSDIDVYIETTSKKIKKRVESINLKIKVKIGLFDSNSLLIKEIIQNHIVLKGVEEFYEKTGFFG